MRTIKTIISFVILALFALACDNKPDTVAVKSISLDSDAISIKVGSSATISVRFTPGNASNQNIIWTSSDESVAVVSDGIVQGIDAGTATITATSEDGGYTDRCKITVEKKRPNVSSIMIEPTSVSLYEGETATLKAIILPEDAYYSFINWKSSDPSVATVEDGVVTAVKNGVVTITATVQDYFKAKCQIEVKAKKRNYLRFTALEEAEISLDITGAVYVAELEAMKTDADNNDGLWTEFNVGDVVKLNKDESLSLRAKSVNNRFSKSVSGYYKFIIKNGKVSASGNIMSLLDQTCTSNYVPEYAFYGLFGSCDNLISAPELPATELSYCCYERMFGSCSNLEYAPELPATKLAINCYSKMFRNCTRLKYIKMMATDISAGGCLTEWTYDVPETGTFVKNKNADWDVRGKDGIPNGWTVQTAEP
ncbi:MAG: Ig domain-containing protein [Bacteroidales bacterium]|nr:Ig domain-containing protein [Bacteroidales bacterium]